MKISRLLLLSLLSTTFCAQAQITYIDADATNTQAVDGTTSPFSTTSVTSDNLWRLRDNFGFDITGNNGIYEKDGATGGYGDASKLETTITGLTPNTEYAVYINFLSDPNSWRVQAGLTENALTLFTPTSEGVENLGLTSVAGSTRNQYRGFIANTTADTSGNIKVYIDDTAATSATNRTWFDGVSYGPPITPPEQETGIIASDGAWTWFNDERAIWHKGKLYVGYVKKNGRISLTQYDPVTKISLETELSTVTEVDDHNAPALHVLPDGKILASYSRHSMDPHFFYRISTVSEPASLSDWGAEATKGNPNGDPHSYANTYAMSAESDKIFAFTRGAGWNPNWTASTDNGVTWSTLKTLIKNGSGSVRPYVRYTGNGIDSIDILYTDGHPRATANSLYHARITGGNVVKSDGSIIKSLADTPLIHDLTPTPERGTVIYQYSAAAQTDPNQWIPTGRAWSWDIQYQKNGDPVATFSVQVDNVTGSDWTDDRIYYYYARWTGTTWQKRFIAQGGRPLYQAEDDYAGGIVIDPDRPNIVYISSNASKPFDIATTTDVPLRANSRYELWKGTTQDDGLTFTWEAVTQDSTENNIRPYVPRNHRRSESLLWLKGTYTSYQNYNTRVMSKIGEKQTSYYDWKSQEGITGAPDEDEDDNGNGIANMLEYHAYVSNQINPKDLIIPDQKGVILPPNPESSSLISKLKTSEDLSIWTTIASSIYGSPFALLQTSDYLMESVDGDLIVTPTTPQPRHFYRLFVQSFGYYLNIPHIEKPEVGIPYDQATFGDLMKRAGYRTAAIGKWHVGYTPGHHPNQQGFDAFWGFIGGHRSYFPPKTGKPFSKANRLEYNGTPIPDDKYLSDKLTDFAIEFIEKKEATQPFFIYLAYNAVHTPMHSKKNDLEAFSSIKNKNRRTLAGMTKGLDDNVGRLMDCLKRNHIDDNTLVIFLNDNGGAPASGADNAPFKGAKGTHSEGGLRVPMLMRFPHHLPAGKSIATPVISLDILPTALSLIHAPIPQDLDGINLLPVMNHEKSATSPRPLFWALSKHIQTVRLGNKKLIRLKLSTGNRQPLLPL